MPLIAPPIPDERVAQVVAKGATASSQCWNQNLPPVAPGTALPPDKVFKHRLAGGGIAAGSDFGEVLYDSLKAYDTDNDQTWSVSELDSAYGTADEWGQKARSFALPDRAILLEAADKNRDGALSEAKVRSWEGLGGHFCENTSSREIVQTLQYIIEKR